MRNLRDYSIEFKMKEGRKKLYKKSVDEILDHFKKEHLMRINEQYKHSKMKTEIELKENNLEYKRIKRIEYLILKFKESKYKLEFNEVIDLISNSTILNGGIVNKKFENARETTYCNLNDQVYSILDPIIFDMLNNYMNYDLNNKFRFYCHQSEAIKMVIQEKKNIIVTTSTSSGKSMCYILPSIQLSIKDYTCLTLIIFPTKALSEDQYLKIKKMLDYLKLNNSLNHPKINKLDGDTPTGQKKEILIKSNIILTNIDFIHWNIEFLSSNIFNRLKLIVIDEAHIYTGHFGINTSYVLKRLLRGIKYYKDRNKNIKVNSDIQYIICTATILNPVEHFNNLVGIEYNNLSLIDNDTSSKGESITLIWDTNKYVNSDFNNSLKKYRSYKECINLLIELYYLDRKIIVFCPTRKLVENMKREMLIILKKLNINDNDRFNFENDIQIYRGGISPIERRKLESLIFEGKVKIVISTIALELGIDVKCFDTVLVFGYPGSINRLMQQFGRCGRDNLIKSIRILLLNENNELDNYISNHSQELLSRNYDSCVINLKNPYLLILHILCLTVESYKNININRDLKIMNIDSELFVEIVKFLWYKNLLCYENFNENLNEINWYYNWNRTKNEFNNGIKFENNSSFLSLYFDNNDQLIFNDIKDAYKQIDIRDSDITISLYDIKDNNNVIDKLPIQSSIRFIYPDSIYSINGKLYVTLSVDLSQRKGIMQEIKKDDKRLKHKTSSSGEISVLMQGNGEKYLLNNSGLTEMQVYITGARITFDIYSYSLYEIINNEWIFLEEKYIKTPLIYSFNTLGMQIKFDLKERFEIETLNIGIHGIIHNVINSLPKYILCNINDISCECPDSKFKIFTKKSQNLYTYIFSVKICNQKRKESNTVSLLIYENKKGGNGYFNELMKSRKNERLIIIEEIITKMEENLSNCKCKNGCLNCGFLLHSCIKNNKYINKKITLTILNNIKYINNKDI